MKLISWCTWCILYTHDYLQLLLLFMTITVFDINLDPGYSVCIKKLDCWQNNIYCGISWHDFTFIVMQYNRLSYTFCDFFMWKRGTYILFCRLKMVVVWNKRKSIFDHSTNSINWPVWKFIQKHKNKQDFLETIFIKCC